MPLSRVRPRMRDQNVRNVYAALNGEGGGRDLLPPCTPVLWPPCMRSGWICCPGGKVSVVVVIEMFFVLSLWSIRTLKQSREGQGRAYGCVEDIGLVLGVWCKNGSIGVYEVVM